MKNIVQIAKLLTVHQKSECVELYHIQEALCYVNIEDESLMKLVYEAFDASYGFPKANFTQEMLQSAECKQTVRFNRVLKSKIKNFIEQNNSYEIVNISKLNRLDYLEFHFLDFAQILFQGVQNPLLKSLYDTDYIYEADEALLELGVLEELIQELLEDYVEQVLRTYTEFEVCLSELWEESLFTQKLEFEKLRELAHKNLGVAKNLRIRDAVILLEEIKRAEDLKYINDCLDLLLSCTIRLKPIRACEAMFQSITELSRFKKLHSNRQKILQTIKE